MKIYIILSEGYEDGSVIEGVYLNLKDAKQVLHDLRQEKDPLDDWLSYNLYSKKVIERLERR